MSRNETIAFYAVLVITSIAVSMLFYRNIICAVVFIPFARRLKQLTEDELNGRRRRAFISQFKDELFVLSTAIGAGRSMKDAIGESIPSLREIYGEDCILGRELELIYERMDKGGENDIQVLYELGIASGVEDVIDFVSVYSICKRTGASLIVAINKAAGVIIDKMTIDKEIREIVRRKEGEGMIILVMPAIIILFLNLSSPDYIDPLYTTIAGRLIMTGVIGAVIGIYGLVKRITDIDI
ncbi:MAG: hypothetical protein KBS68_06795 [Clostridiales bacterium]|nr:hypothetical protein [Candidatus Crickella merdequi]